MWVLDTNAWRLSLGGGFVLGNVFIVHVDHLNTASELILSKILLVKVLNVMME